MAPRIRNIASRVINYGDEWTEAQIPAPEAPRPPPAQRGLNHPVLHFSSVSEEHAKLEMISDYGFLDTCVFPRELLTSWAEWQFFEDTLGARWTTVLMPLAPTFQELTLEFHATLRVHMGQLDHRRAISFALGRVTYEMSLADLAVHLGFYSDEEAHDPSFEDLPRGITRGAAKPHMIAVTVLETFWETIADDDFISGIPESLILNPRHRLIHRIIANTICGRHNSQEKVQQTDLLCLWSILTRTPINQACLFIDLASRSFSGRDAQFTTGPYITRIAHSLGIFTRWPRRAFTRVYQAPSIYDHDRMIYSSMCPADPSIQGFVPTPEPAERLPRASGLRHPRPTARALPSRKRGRRSEAGTSGKAGEEAEPETEGEESIEQRLDRIERTVTEMRIEFRMTMSRMEQLLMAVLDRQEGATAGRQTDQGTSGTPADDRGKRPMD